VTFAVSTHSFPSLHFVLGMVYNITDCVFILSVFFFVLMRQGRSQPNIVGGRGEKTFRWGQIFVIFLPNFNKWSFIAFVVM